MYKSRLQELCQQKQWRLPNYLVLKDGLDHNPRFKAFVTVNGIPYYSPDFCKSSKETQNEATVMAINALTTHDHPFHVITTPDPTTVVGDAAADMSHLYKDRRLKYAQKQNLGVPIYNFEYYGPRHYMCFRAVISIDGKSFSDTSSFTKLKGAQHAAAKVALMPLSANQSDVSKAQGEVVSPPPTKVSVRPQFKRIPRVDVEAQVDNEDQVHLSARDMRAARREHI